MQTEHDIPEKGPAGSHPDDSVPVRRIVSGIQPSGRLHLGNYMGALKNWIDLQTRYEAFFFIADWHALTTNYEDTTPIRENIIEMLVDWLSLGLNPEKCTIFLQSDVLEHAELNLLLSMVTPVSWLERNPSYKDQQTQITGRERVRTCFPPVFRDPRKKTFPSIWRASSDTGVAPGGSPVSFETSVIFPNFLNPSMAV